ncbi:hypothetical protein KY290_024665 [Solanum tuberosum]|uniref:Uncharacterized protein n=1 Tax=Solanum tuberosum TaxID=4113 RepID=A0ABQ7URC0_SOLTU|nr:hypothetical protein KY284_023510 [Solanum tuberosum]KAH0754395.1 hypothetical protein KY290_024665 [Solanum tuberosum]
MSLVMLLFNKSTFPFTVRDDVVPTTLASSDSTHITIQFPVPKIVPVSLNLNIPTNRCQDAPMQSPFSSSNQLASAYATDTMDPTISMQIPFTTGGQPTTNGISPSNNLTRCQSMPNHSPSNSSLHPTLLKSHKMVTRAQTDYLKPKQPVSLFAVTSISPNPTCYLQAAKDKN